MVDISDSPYRQLVKDWGADVVYSEMISAEALIRKVPKSLRQMKFQAAEKPVVIQLMCNKPETLTKAAKIVEKVGASGIDLNFGCPARKIANNFCGVMLMRDLELSHQLIQAAIEAVSIPVSIKIRTSINCEGTHWNKDGKRKKITVIDFLKKMNDLPIAAVMIHGRSFEAPYDGPADLQTIAEVKKIFKTGPVLANGALTTIESSAEILKITNADGLGLARSSLGKPWIFKQVKDYLKTGSYKEITWAKEKSTMLKHAQLFYDFYGPGKFMPMRRHLAHYIKGLPHAADTRKQLLLTNNPQEVKKILDSIDRD